jgi:hypothetical protein
MMSEDVCWCLGVHRSDLKSAKNPKKARKLIECAKMLEKGWNIRENASNMFAKGREVVYDFSDRAKSSKTPENSSKCCENAENDLKWKWCCRKWIGIDRGVFANDGDRPSMFSKVCECAKMCFGP